MAQPTTIRDRPGRTLTRRHDAQGFHLSTLKGVPPAALDQVSGLFEDKQSRVGEPGPGEGDQQRWPAESRAPRSPTSVS
jgi:hypothetical protein